MDRQKEDSYQIVNYYKRNRTIDMLLMEEFAFSLLFNNIAPDKLQVALDSVGLNRIPSLFLLIQVDDHLNESKRLNTENEFVLKVPLLTSTSIVNELDGVIQNVYLSLSRGNRVLFSRTMVKLFSLLQENGRSREQTLLLAGMLIDKIVYEVGFSSANYFEVVFRKEIGMPPTVYRRMHRE